MRLQCLCARRGQLCGPPQNHRESGSRQASHVHTRAVTFCVFTLVNPESRVHDNRHTRLVTVRSLSASRTVTSRQSSSCTRSLSGQSESPHTTSVITWNNATLARINQDRAACISICHLESRPVGAHPPHLSLSPHLYQPRSITHPSSPNTTGPTRPMSPQRFSLGRSHACGPHSPRACTRAERSPPAARVAELPECICPSTITRTSPCPSVAAPSGGSRYPPWPHRRPWPRSWPRVSLGY